jgi:hypothetical protein
MLKRFFLNQKTLNFSFRFLFGGFSVSGKSKDFSQVKGKSREGESNPKIFGSNGHFKFLGQVSYLDWTPTMSDANIE